MMSQAIGLRVNMELNIAGSDVDALLEESVTLGRELARFGNTLVITLGSLGVMIVRSGLSNEPFYKSGRLITGRISQVAARFYPVKRETSFANVSGAGDCFASGFIMSMLQGRTEAECVSCGLATSLQALQSISAVPQTLMSGNYTNATYRNM